MPLEKRASLAGLPIILNVVLGFSHPKAKHFGMLEVNTSQSQHHQKHLYISELSSALENVNCCYSFKSFKVPRKKKEEKKPNQTKHTKTNQPNTLRKRVKSLPMIVAFPHDQGLLWLWPAVVSSRSEEKYAARALSWFTISGRTFSSYRWCLYYSHHLGRFSKCFPTQEKLGQTQVWGSVWIVVSPTISPQDLDHHLVHRAQKKACGSSQANVYKQSELSTHQK